MATDAEVLFYKSGKDWRWHLKRGPRIMADCGQGYSRRIDCVKGFAFTREYPIEQLQDAVREAAKNGSTLIEFQNREDIWVEVMYDADK